MAIGLMSGSSLDGVDLAAADFFLEDGRLKNWELKAAQTFPYQEEWIQRLSQLPFANALSYAHTHAQLGLLFGDMIQRFIAQHSLQPDLIASHGHTIFHHPEKQMTAQIGEGAAIASATGYTVVSDFRAQDLANGGQGAPLAPLADRHLFPGHDFYLNLGGIANISCNTGSKIVAFDLAAANQVFNALAQSIGQPYDEDGKIAASGQLLEDLLQKANQNPYYQLSYPKSLDNQWVKQEVCPLYLNAQGSVEDRMHTAVCQLAQQCQQAIQQIVQQESFDKVSYELFVSGGGALNSFLLEKIREYTNRDRQVHLVIPDRSIIEYKEALLMGLMGVFRLEHIPNCLSSVTGASRNAVGGAIHQGWKQPSLHA